MDSQIELYRHKRYRKRRVQFYGLIALAMILFSMIVGIFVISLQPIDVTGIKDAHSALEVAEEEYGEPYINKLINLPTIGYESYYQSLRDTYVGLMKDDGSVKDKNRIAVDLIAFVEYVESDAVQTAESYSLTGKSEEFNKQYGEYKKVNGEVFPILVELVGNHPKDSKGLTDEEVKGYIEDLDKRMEMYVTYLTNLKNA